MRTSNKILTGGFIAFILIVVGIHVTLSAKIKSGGLVSFERKMRYPSNAQVDFTNIKQVYISGMHECKVVPSNVIRLQMNENWQKHFKYRVNADTLFVEANLGEQDLSRGTKVYLPITINLTPGIMINAKYSGIFLQGSTEPVSQPSQSIELNNSELRLIGMDREAPVAHFDSLYINSTGHSTIFGLEQGLVKKLQVTLANNSLLNDQGAIFETFNLHMDSTSSVNLHASNLQKFKLNP